MNPILILTKDFFFKIHFSITLHSVCGSAEEYITWTRSRFSPRRETSFRKGAANSVYKSTVKPFESDSTDRFTVFRKEDYEPKILISFLFLAYFLYFEKLN
jgi:hypothetical protein